jgi:hypothetical protein
LSDSVDSLQLGQSLERGTDMGTWIDFKTVKNLAGFQAVLEHYGIKLRTTGHSQLRGRCPLPQHSSADSRDSFNVNVDRNIWSCKSGSCIAARNGKEGGNILDFVCTMEQCTLPEGARKMMEWFGSKPNQQSSATNGTTGASAKPVSEKRLSREARREDPKPDGCLPEAMVKELPFMQQIEIWFADLIKLRDNESDGEYHTRVLNGVKTKILDSYRNGKKAAAPSAK